MKTFNRTFSSILHFFIQSPEYDKMISEELYILAKHINISYYEALEMSVYERRMQIEILKEDIDRQNKEIESQKQASKAKSKWSR